MVAPTYKESIMENEKLLFINPATGTKFGEVSISTPEAVQIAVDEMRKSFPVWSGKSLRERIGILLKFQALLIDQRDEITNILNQDCGKSRQAGVIELLIKQVPELTPFVRVVHGNSMVGAALTQAKPDYIFMTGSTPTGKKIMQAAAENLTPVALELGGKDAMIVLEDADLEAAARWGAWGAFFNTGQTCMAVERVYVVESKYDEFVKLALANTKEFKTGYTTDLNSPYSMGPVTDPRQVKTIERHLEDALAKGAHLLTEVKKDGMFFNPIVIENVNHSMLLMT